MDALRARLEERHGAALDAFLRARQIDNLEWSIDRIQSRHRKQRGTWPSEHVYQQIIASMVNALGEAAREDDDPDERAGDASWPYLRWDKYIVPRWPGSIGDARWERDFGAALQTVLPWHTMRSLIRKAYAQMPQEHDIHDVFDAAEGKGPRDDPEWDNQEEAFRFIEEAVMFALGNDAASLYQIRHDKALITTEWTDDAIHAVWENIRDQLPDRLVALLDLPRDE